VRHQAAAHPRRDPAAVRNARHPGPCGPLEGRAGLGGAVQDNWLASFGDAQLDALVLEALAAIQDLRVAASKVEQAGQYVVVRSPRSCPP
jgi:outer membrane protein TolC